MTALLPPPAPVRSRRGGNRLPAARYPARGPAYERVRRFGHDHERRDRHQRERMRRAIKLAADRGELRHTLALVLYRLVELCNDRCLEPGPEGSDQRCSGWWSLRFIHDLVYPALGDDGTVLAERHPDDRTGARTAGTWMSELAELGWVQAVHRYHIVNGNKTGTSNLWRLQIPHHLRVELHQREDDSRSRAARKRAESQRTTRRHTIEDPRPGAARAVMDANDRRRSDPCGTCNGDGWVPSPTDPAEGVVRCPSCAGSGAARAGP